jgi:hypothetical protein
MGLGEPDQPISIPLSRCSVYALLRAGYMMIDGVLSS